MDIVPRSRDLKYLKSGRGFNVESFFFYRLTRLPDKLIRTECTLNTEQKNDIYMYKLYFFFINIIYEIRAFSWIGVRRFELRPAAGSIRFLNEIRKVKKNHFDK